jgi:hypothetical protein
MCFNSDLSKKWEFNAESNGPNGSNYSNPVIGCDGTIYFYSCINEEGPLISKLFAINPDGTKKWEVILPGLTYNSSCIIGKNENILAATSNGFICIIKDGIIIKSAYTNYNFNGWNASFDIQANLFFINGDDTSGNSFLFIINPDNFNSPLTVTLPGSGLYSNPIQIGDYIYQGTSLGYLCKINKYNGSI